MRWLRPQLVIVVTACAVVLWLMAYCDIIMTTINAVSTEEVFDFQMRIFVYDIPPSILFREMPVKDSAGSNDPGYGIEWVIPRLFESSRFRTLNPGDADIFFVPHYLTAYFHFHFQKGYDVAEIQHANPYFAQIIHYLETIGPWLRRRNGTDHVFVFAHDSGACMLNASNLVAVRNGIFLTNMASLTIGDRQACFDRTRDIVVPPVELLPEFLEFRRNKLLPDLSDRRQLVYFRGTVWDQLSYSGGVRQALKHLYKNDTDMVFHGGATTPAIYLQELRDSYFCLHPSGWVPWKWSGRFIHLIYSGCIPVIIMDDVLLPLQQRLDYDLFSVRVTEKDVKEGRMMAVLRSISQQERRLKMAAVWEIALRLSYNFPPKPADAFSSILWSLSNRLNQ